MLQAICLNNLGILYKKVKKYKRSLESSFKGINIIKEHLKFLSAHKKKKRII